MPHLRGDVMTSVDTGEQRPVAIAPEGIPGESGHKEAIILYPGGPRGRTTIELRINPDGSNEAFLVPSGAVPIPTGVSLRQSGDRYHIFCRIRKKWLAFKPEEVVRQRVLNWFIDELDYSENQIAVEVGVQMGSTVHDKPADVVIYTDASKARAWIVAELKKPNRKDGVEQLKSYMNPLGAVFGYWTNGIDYKYLLRTDTNDFSKPILRLPRRGETLADVDEPLTREKLEPVADLYGVFKDIEQNIQAHQSLDTFNEIFKVVFAKLYDERVNLPKSDSVARFRLGLTEDSATAAKNVRDLFEAAKNKWRDVYEPSDKFLLNDENLTYCIKALQPFHLIRSGDVLGVAFELLVNQEMKGEMGQYFTPRQVVNMMVRMMNPRIEETVCDPACGSGGFLIYPMRRVFDYIERVWDNADDRAEQRKDYAQERLVGIDNDPRLIKVAKAYMIMENDGRGGMFPVDALDYRIWEKSLRERVVGRRLRGSDFDPSVLVDRRLPTDGVDVVLTNPPFAGAIKTPTTLRQYSLAFDPKGTLKKGVVRAILFLERCLDILKPGGRMGIVLPQGLFNNINTHDVRKFVDTKARVLAVVGLHPYTFKPFTLAKTSVLFLQKWPEGEYLEDYPIFTAVSMRPGKTKLGAPQYLDDGHTLDCDMDGIADEFLVWARDQWFGFAEAE
jgi:type I restriction enzyme M protein